MGGFLTPMHRKQAAAQLYALQQKENEARSKEAVPASAASGAQEESIVLSSSTPGSTAGGGGGQDPALSSLFSSYEKEGENA